MQGGGLQITAASRALRTNPSGLRRLPGMKTFPPLPPPGLILLGLAGAVALVLVTPPAAHPRRHAALCSDSRNSLALLALSFGRFQSWEKNDGVARKGEKTTKNTKNPQRNQTQPTERRRSINNRCVPGVDRVPGRKQGEDGRRGEVQNLKTWHFVYYQTKPPNPRSRGRQPQPLAASPQGWPLGCCSPLQGPCSGRDNPHFLLLPFPPAQPPQHLLERGTGAHPHLVPLR